MADLGWLEGYKGQTVDELLLFESTEGVVQILIALEAAIRARVEAEGPLKMTGVGANAARDNGFTTGRSTTAVTSSSLPIHRGGMLRRCPTICFESGARRSPILRSGLSMPCSFQNRMSLRSKRR